MANTPSAVAAQVLDAIGSDFDIGDISEGSREAQVMLRAYGQCLRQLLRGANWDFARASAPLLLLADATGQTPNVGTVVPSGYIYEYAYPIDCMKLRFIQRSQQFPGSAYPAGNVSIPPNIPTVPNLGTPFPGSRPRPARFVLATDSNYPASPGSLTWDSQGVGPNSRTVVLTDVQCAHATYTALILYPSQWDSLFRAALVAYIASEVALPLTANKPFGMQVRNQQIAIAKQKIEMARLVDGNEATTSSDIPVDWMNARRTGGFGFGRGGYGGYGGDGWGDGWGAGWDSVGFCDGSAY
jgi:hypothetical protein